jgi:hypothetical protein
VSRISFQKQFMKNLTPDPVVPIHFPQVFAATSTFS